MLEKLTQEQESKLSQYRDKWLAIGLSTEPCDVEKSKAAAIEAYRLTGLPEPKLFLTLDNPISAAIGAAMLKDTGDQVEGQVWDQVWDQVRGQVRGQVWDQVQDQVRGQVLDQVRGQVGGCHDAHWLGFYDFFISECGIQGCDRILPLIEIANNCGWWSPYGNAVIFQHRPKEIHFDDSRRLHKEDGPAILYRDGLAVYSWHGTRVPEEWITDKSSVTAKTAITWDNVEQRRAACEILGWTHVLDELNARSIDKHQNPMIGELLEVDIPDIGKERFLRVMCGTQREFALPVPPETKTAISAQAWLNWAPEDNAIPQIRT